VEAGSISLHITAVAWAGSGAELAIVRLAPPRAACPRAHVPDDIPPVAADAERCTRSWDNLSTTPVKYAPEGSTVNAVVRLSGGAVETVVSNRPDRIAPTPTACLTGFYRADPSRSAAAGGVGWGLSISRELAGAMKAGCGGTSTDAGNLRGHLSCPRHAMRLSNRSRCSTAVA